ncbi:MAG: trypsin-like peptidase domain-containing protein [Symploca sp. SIO2G7]|nr:trypsin-like peptidase domain-containing protein [Symploca sp. SIO2G7]
MQLLSFQREALRQALMSAFPTPTKLDMLLDERLEIPLNQTATTNQPYGDVVFEVIRWANSEGRLEELVSEAYRRKPRNPKFRQFMATYGIDTNPMARFFASGNPEFNWLGPNEERELQGFWRAEPEIWDMGFLKRGVDQAAAICRIELSDGKAIGTGFLIAPNYLLTNYHVLAPNLDSDPHAYLPEMVFRFATLTDPMGHETYGSVRKLTANPLRKFSVTHELDYALLELDIDQSQLTNVISLSMDLSGGRSLATNDSIYLLHHPSGQTMKVSLGSRSGITGVYPAQGVVQYISKTAQGSSGAPCFNEQWELVAIHYAEISGAVGVKCEGILFSAVYPHIKDYLP